MLSFCLKMVIFGLSMLLTERQFRITHMVYTIEPTIHVRQAPSSEPKYFIQTVYKTPPPLPHPAIDLEVRFAFNSSKSPTDGAVSRLYSQYHTLVNSDVTETRAISAEELQKHPKYRPRGEIDASEGRHEAKKYVDRFRKPSLRKEVHAVVLYEQPPQPPPLNINWLLLFYIIVFGISIVLVCFGVLNIKRNQTFLNHKAATKKRLEISISNLPIGWILRHIDLQNAYHSETQRLKAKVNRLRNKVANQRTRIRVLTTKRVENRFKNAFMHNKVKDLADKVANLDRGLNYLKSLHDLTMAMVDPEAAFIRRFDQDAGEAEEKFLAGIRARPGKARSSPLQWWEEQRRDIELAKNYLERKGQGRNWRLNPYTLDRLRAKGMLEPGFFDRPAPSQKVLKRRAVLMKGW
jgi:hypothetical protein